MIVNKTYEVNDINLDSVITAMAKDIEEGYTLYKVKTLPLEYSTNIVNFKPSMIFTLHNKKADLEGVGWL